MCGRYTTNTEEELIEIRDILKDISIRISNEETVYLNKEISPTCKAPVITNNKEIRIVKWGFTKWDNKGVIFNTRSETVDKNKYFIKSLENNRCVIPARFYFEWEHIDKEKNKYLIKTNDNIIYMAGIMKCEDNNTETYSILTKDAEEEIDFIHDRMPVLINKEDINDWLNGDMVIGDLVKNDFELVYERVR